MKHTSQSYLNHIEKDYHAWQEEIAALDRGGVYARAKEIAYMPRIYERLRNLTDEGQIESLSRLAYPVQEVYTLWHELDGLTIDSLADLETVLYDSYEHGLFADAKRVGSSAPEPAQFVFFRKPVNAIELRSGNATHTRHNVDVIRVVELSQANYDAFGCDLLAEYAFIDAFKRDMCFGDSGMTCHALLVKSDSSKDGILVCSMGYSYARYAAFVSDCNALNLDRVPVQSADIRPPKRQRQQPER